MGDDPFLAAGAWSRWQRGRRLRRTYLAEQRNGDKELLARLRALASERSRVASVAVLASSRPSLETGLGEGVPVWLLGVHWPSAANLVAATKRGAVHLSRVDRPHRFWAFYFETSHGEATSAPPLPLLVRQVVLRSGPPREPASTPPVLSHSH
jgi:hypothetical protein